MNSIELSHVTKTYKQFQLKDISLELPEGTILGLVGENGAGKTTTIRLILEMAKRESGTITVLGETELKAHPELKEDIGVVMDDVSLPATMRMDEIEKVMSGIYRSWDSARYNELIRVLNIPDRTPFGMMSRGNKMKAGFAVALAHHPKLLLLDEATSGLDPVVRDELLDILMDFTRDEKNSILMSSHIVNDLEKACDYIAFMHAGELILVEEKDRIHEQYGKIRCTEEELKELDPEAVVGRRTTSYGVEAIVIRDRIPAMDVQPVDIEELFVMMVKGETR